MPTPPASADAAHNLFIASICRRWRRLAQRHVSTLLVKEDRLVSRQDVLTAVACFPNLAHLHLSDGSVETLDNSFLADLPSLCPGLRALHVGKLMMAADNGQHGRRHRFITKSGLDYFFRHCTQLEQVSLYYIEENQNPPASFFQLQHLSILVLTNTWILKPPNLSHLSSLTAVSIEASSLHYDQLFSLLQLTNLTRLSLPDKIRLISPGPPAFSLAQLPALESLKFGLRGAQFSVFPPLESPYSSLKRLQLSKCFSQERLPDSIGEMLPCLQELSISGCESFRDLTDEFTSLTCLESLTISSCPLSALPENFGNLPALKTLVLRTLRLSHFPASFTRLASLESLFVFWCIGVDTLPAGFGRLTALQTLSLEWLMNLDLPEDLGGLTNFQTFHLTKNTEEQLPPLFTQLASLTRLELDRCEIAELPAGMAEMTNLQELCLRKCPAINELPEFVTALVNLQVLRIQECRRLSSVPRRLDSLTRLKELELRKCWLLREAQALPFSLQALSYFENSQHMVSPPDISRLTELGVLFLGIIRAPFLDAIAASLASLSGLEHLQVQLGEDAEEFLSLLARLPRLRVLALKEARSLNRLVESDGPALQELRQLNIHTTGEELTALPAAITTLHRLTSIQIHARRLSSLPDAIGAFSRLRRLDLSNCWSLTHLPASLTQLSCLHHLNASNTRIRLLPAGFAQLSRLKFLDLQNCKQLLALPYDIGDLRVLQQLLIEGCDMLHI